MSAKISATGQNLNKSGLVICWDTRIKFRTNLGQLLFFPVANVAVYKILLLEDTTTGMHLGQPISNIGLEHGPRKFCNRAAVEH